MTDTVGPVVADMAASMMLAGHQSVYPPARQPVNPDPLLVSDPLFVLLAWAGGVALAGAGVTVRSVVGVGFTWLAAGTALLIGIWPALGGDWAAVAASAAVAGGGLVVRRSRLSAGVALAVGAGLFALAATELGGAFLTLSALLALGGITGEMLLGHWYLVDPTLPRTALRALAWAGFAGIAVDVLAVSTILDLVGGDFRMAVYWVMAGTTAILMLAVVGALRYPAYSGVMAATGLSYLAVITGLAAVFLGRALSVGVAAI